jgi:hypothetical protein
VTDNIKRILGFVLTFTLYTLFGLLLLDNPYLASFFLVTFLGMLFGNNTIKEYCTNVWFQIDVLAGSVFHFKKRRTVSGITGERAINERYGAIIMEKLINKLFNDDLHCRRAYYHEIKLIEFEDSLKEKQE